MILPKHITAYSDSDASPETSRAEVEKFLLKFGIKTFMWNRDSPENTYLLFKYNSTKTNEPMAFKVNVPFIEKYDPHKKPIYNEKRSYRFFWHIFKSCMLMSEIGMTVEQVFRDFLVIGKHPDGTPMTLGEKYDIALESGQLSAMPALI